MAHILLVLTPSKVLMLCQVSMLSICPSDIPVFRFQMVSSDWPFQPELHHVSCFDVFWKGCCLFSFFDFSWVLVWCVSVYTSATDLAIFIQLNLVNSPIFSLCFVQCCWWYLGLSLSSCLYGDLRYLIRKLIRSNFCKHSLNLGFDLNFSRGRIGLNDD